MEMGNEVTARTVRSRYLSPSRFDQSENKKRTKKKIGKADQQTCQHYAQGSVNKGVKKLECDISFFPFLLQTSGEPFSIHGCANGSSQVVGHFHKIQPPFDPLLPAGKL